MEFDLLIKNGTVVDGSGRARYQGDVGVKNGRIQEIGKIGAPAQRTINADGLIVAPGFIDGHTHMDAQVAWDPLGSCSCWHGVTTVFMGNCGFALAPCGPDDHEWYARCLEAVEDIPTEAMMAGIDWNWETFPEYLVNLERLPKGINYGAYIGHSALRMYVMGERALDQVAKEEDLAKMAYHVQQALKAGAIGFSTSRATTHITPDGTPVPSRIAEWRELEHLVSAMAELNAGVFQIGPDIASGASARAFMEELKKICLNTRRRVMFSLAQTSQGDDPLPYQSQLDFIDQVVAEGGQIWGQCTTRSINAIFSAKSNLPFDVLPAWKEIRKLPLHEQMAHFANPEVRERLIEDEAGMKPRDQVVQGGGAATTNPRKPDYSNLFVMQGVDWDDPSVDDFAKERGQNHVDVMLDLVLENEDQIFVQPLINEDRNHIQGMLQHPRALATFSDSGAHVCQEMGSSLQTHMLNYWVRGQEVFSLEEAVRMMTLDNAAAWGLTDRGLLEAGKAADIVLFDETEVRPCIPTVQEDLPGGARRLVQKAEGIHYTVVNGEVTLEDGVSTGNYAGQVIKGPLADVS
jgi:N-acyl-D-amino-acid deacylase